MIRTTKDIVKILPLDEEFKKDLIDSYDNLSEDSKFNIGRMLWAAYKIIFGIKLEKNMAIAFEEAMENREKLDKNFYNRIRDLTMSEMDHVTAEEIQAMDLDITRDKLAEIIKADN